SASNDTSSLCYVSSYTAHRHLHSFPTRRSSDLSRTFALFATEDSLGVVSACPRHLNHRRVPDFPLVKNPELHPASRSGSTSTPLDRKSTRLNSSHVKISYAVFCLKKKKEYCP